MITSSGVSGLSGVPLLPNLGATIFERAKILSGGGPPFGCPLITTLSPDKT